MIAIINNTPTKCKQCCVLVIPRETAKKCKIDNSSRVLVEANGQSIVIKKLAASEPTSDTEGLENTNRRFQPQVSAS